MTETSIVIRTFNEEKHIGNLLKGIQSQEYKDFEIVIVDSGSNDRTLEIAKEFPVKILKINSRDFTFGYSLNVGCEASAGKYLVFVSAHVIPTDEHWLGNLIKPFENEKVAMVYGRQFGYSTSKFSEKMDFKRLFGHSPVNSKVPLNYANNANSAVRKDLWEKRKFDEYLFGLEDIDWARTVANEGYIVHYEPSAGIYHIHEERWSQVFNRYRREAIAAVRIGLCEPPQVKLKMKYMFWYILTDLVSSLPHYTRARIEEIVRFRYYQWKGSKIGWTQGMDLDFDTEKEKIFFPADNRGVLIKGVGNAEYTDVPLPEMKPGDILLKVDYVGVCRTDLEVFEGTLGYYRDGVATYPIVPGHEFSATIVKIGSNNKYQERFKVGQRVVGECILSRGEHSHREEVGVINHNGAYSQFVIAPGDSIHKIPDNLDSKTAVLSEPLAVVLRALRRIEYRLKQNSKIAVIGAGQIGNLCAQVLAHRGYTVTLFDRDENRLNLLKNKGIMCATTMEHMDAFDVIVEATGAKNALELAIRHGKVDCTMLLLGFPYGKMEYNFEDIVGKEKVIIGSVGADGVDFESALALLPQLDMNAFTQVVITLGEFKDAWKTHMTFKHLKILLQP